MILSVSPLLVLASLSSAMAIGLFLHRVAPPPKRLRRRVEPYVFPSAPDPVPYREGAFRSVFGPIVRDVAEAIGRLIDRSGSEITVLRIRQAGWFRGLSEAETVAAFRIRQLRVLGFFTGAALLVGHLLGASPAMRLVFVGLGLVVGATRTKAQLERAVSDRRDLMKIEIYTVNQLLAMRVRAGGGVLQAVKATTQRGSGEVIADLEDALRLHRSGWSGPDAFRRIAELTPEPFCSRTYRLLAIAEERGADLGKALLALSEDVRETRRESMKRTATKRRATMLVPTIAILAPVLIVFVAAPLPYLITSWQ